MKSIQKLNILRQAMEEQGLDAYIIPASDPHQDEYIPDCWQYRSWISGFTGSAGTIVVMKDIAGLWTDSRYFVQAEKQLQGSGFELFKLNIPHTPEHVTWMASHLPDQAKVGIDDRFFAVGMIQYISNTLAEAGHQLITGIDLLSPIWTDQPALPTDPVFVHDLHFAGLSRYEKLQQVARKMAEVNADYHLITTLDDIAWLLNLRCTDIVYCPVFISYCIVTQHNAHLFIHREKISELVADALSHDGVIIHPYEAIADFLAQIPAGSVLLLAPDKVNHALFQSVPPDVKKKYDMNITTGLKAIKNPIEIEGLKRVMIKDGAAWVKMFYWLNQQVHSGAIESEWSAAQKIAECRSFFPDYQGESFHPISSHGWHGAVVHYSVTKEESLNFGAEGIYLLDSGGHYSDGTTDTTRTIALSAPDQQQKQDFTLALKGTLGVSMLRFPAGTKGFQMDILARKALWDAGLNYGHGTGHGVGFFLSVHEGPQTIGTSASGYLNVTLEPGMVTTVEPGLYREGHYGVRTENMTLVVEDQVNEFGTFYRFETLTLVPIDRQLIDKDLLTPAELSWINNYHQRVYAELADSLTENERIWLQAITQPL